MAVMRWTFANLYERFRAKAYKSPGDDETVEAKQTVNDGYLMWASEYPWTCLRQTATVSLTEADEGTAALAANFAELTDDPILVLSGQGTRPRLEWRTPEWIKEQVELSLQTANVPLYYAVEELAFVSTTGSRRQLIVYPWPNADYTLSVPYRIEPTTMTADAEFPMGASAHGPTILAAAFAIWEYRTGRTDGVMHKLYQDALAISIRRDGQQQARILGKTPPEHAVSRRRWAGPVTYDS